VQAGGTETEVLNFKPEVSGSSPVFSTVINEMYMSQIGDEISQRLLSVKVNGETYTYRVVFERDEDGRIVADCPALDGCYTEGRTLEEANEMMKDALQLTIESYLVEGDELPLVEYERKRAKRMSISNRRIQFSNIPL